MDRIIDHIDYECHMTRLIVIFTYCDFEFNGSITSTVSNIDNEINGYL